MERKFDGKVAVIAGGTGGIGNAIVELLSAQGARIIVGDTDEIKLEKLQEKAKGQIIGMKTDVTKNEDQKNLMESAVERFGRIDMAFNVAGGSKLGLIDDIPEKDWMWTIDLCLKGVFLGMKYQMAVMKKTGGGSIVNISSVNAIMPMWGDSAYNSAKAAVLALTQTGALEGAECGIRVNAVLPGLTDTKMTADWTAVREIKEAFMERIPAKRMGRPEEIAKAAIFMASDDAGYINGTSLIVDGGWSAAGYPDISPQLKADRSLWQC